MSPKDKIVSLGEARNICRERRARGGKIILTSGCFDLLHGGHLDHICEVGSMGFLVVGVNDDAFVKKLKGPSRPVRREHDRAYLIAGFSSVGLVVIFGSDYELIAAIKPNAYVTSRTASVSIWEDHKRVKLLEEIGADIIELEHREKIDSTTAIIERSVAWNIAT